MAILTVSRELGSGGREVGLAAAGSLKYEYVNKERLLRDAGAAGVKWARWGRELDEHCPNLWEKYDWSFAGYSALLRSLILGYALADNAAVMGRGGNFLLEGVPHALRVRVVAPLESRIERVMKRESLDRRQAGKLIKKIERERECVIRYVYHKKWDDPAEYDMVFDTGTMSIEEIAEILKTALLERDGRRTEEAVRALRMRALAAKVRAGIATDKRFFVPTLEVLHDGTAVVLRGTIHDPGEHKRLEERAKALAEGVPVRCELHYRGA